MARDVTIKELKGMGLPQCSDCRRYRLAERLTRFFSENGGNVEIAYVGGLIVDGVDITAEV